MKEKRSCRFTLNGVVHNATPTEDILIVRGAFMNAYIDEERATHIRKQLEHKDGRKLIINGNNTSIPLNNLIVAELAELLNAYFYEPCHCGSRLTRCICTGDIEVSREISV